MHSDRASATFATLLRPRNILPVFNKYKTTEAHDVNKTTEADCLSLRSVKFDTKLLFTYLATLVASFSRLRSSRRVLRLGRLTSETPVATANRETDR